jgi:hypothetical protein
MTSSCSSYSHRPTRPSVHSLVHSPGILISPTTHQISTTPNSFTAVGLLQASIISTIDKPPAADRRSGPKRQQSGRSDSPTRWGAQAPILEECRRDEQRSPRALEWKRWRLWRRMREVEKGVSNYTVRVLVWRDGFARLMSGCRQRNNDGQRSTPYVKGTQIALHVVF